MSGPKLQPDSYRERFDKMKLQKGNTGGYFKWLRRGFFSIAHRSQLLVFGFICLFFMVRMIPPSEIGVWVLFMSVTSVMELIRNGFIRNPFIVFYVTAPDNEKPKVLSASLFIHSLLALLIALFMVLMAGPLSEFWRAPSLRQLFLIYAPTSIALIPFLHIEYLLQSDTAFKSIFTANFLRNVFPAIYVVVCFIGWRHFGLVEMAIVQMISTIIGAGMYYVMLRAHKPPPLTWKIEKGTVMRLLNFGKFAFGTTVSSTVFRSTDGWMIGKMLSNASVAFYNPAIRIANLVELPTLSIVNLLFSEVTRKLSGQSHENIRTIYAKSVSLVLAVVVPLCASIFFLAGPIVDIIFGPEYASAVPVLRVSVFYMLIIPFNRQFGTMMDAMKKPQINFYFLLMAAGINVILNYLLIIQFGLIGAAYATVTTYIVLFILNQSYLYINYGIVFADMFLLTIEWYKLGFSLGLRKISGLLGFQSQAE